LLKANASAVRVMIRLIFMCERLVSISYLREILKIQLLIWLQK
jgi:hypothetical protein